MIGGGPPTGSLAARPLRRFRKRPVALSGALFIAGKVIWEPALMFGWTLLLTAFASLLAE